MDGETLSGSSLGSDKQVGIELQIILQPHHPSVQVCANEDTSLRREAGFQRFSALGEALNPGLFVQLHITIA